MAFINKKTHEILQAFDEGLAQDDYIAVDDLIALPIASLHKKGYQTVEFKAGNPFPYLHCLDTQINLKNGVDFDKLSEPIKDTEEHAFVHLRTYRDRISYIKFEEDLPEELDVPDGWLYDPDENMLYVRYSKKPDPYLFTIAQVKHMQALMNWIMEIPAK